MFNGTDSEISNIVLSQLREAIDFYKEAYLNEAIKKAAHDLSLTKVDAYKKSWDHYMTNFQNAMLNRYQLDFPGLMTKFYANSKDFVLPIIYNFESWINDHENVVLYPDFGFDTGFYRNWFFNKTMKIPDLADERVSNLIWAVANSMKSVLVPISKNLVDSIENEKQTFDELRVASSLKEKERVVLEESLAKAEEVLESVPSIAEIDDRIANNLDPLTGEPLDQPVQETVEEIEVTEKPKSKKGLIIGALAVGALLLTGKNK